MRAFLNLISLFLILLTNSSESNCSKHYKNKGKPNFKQLIHCPQQEEQLIKKEERSKLNKLKKMLKRVEKEVKANLRILLKLVNGQLPQLQALLVLIQVQRFKSNSQEMDKSSLSKRSLLIYKIEIQMMNLMAFYMNQSPNPVFLASTLETLNQYSNSNWLCRANIIQLV